MRVLFLDCETTGRDGIDALLPEPEAPSNYRDKQKIADYKDEQRASLRARAGLDCDLCQVIALGWAVDDEPVHTLLQDEPAILQQAQSLIAQADRIVGFNLPGFDLRVLSRRALLLGLHFPRLQLGRYRFDHRITDLQHELSFGDGPQKGKGLQWYCRLFGIEAGAEDERTGSEIAALVAAGDWPAVEQHVRCDVERTRALAYRSGLVRQRQTVSA